MTTGPAKQKNTHGTIMQEITNAVRRLSKIIKTYEDVGDGLETPIHLRLSEINCSFTIQ